MPKQIAPRLATGESRVSFGHGLPPAVRAAVREIAEDEGKSQSWVMEEIITDWAVNESAVRPGVKAVRPPKYKPRKGVNGNGTPTKEK